MHLFPCHSLSLSTVTMHRNLVNRHIRGIISAFQTNTSPFSIVVAVESNLGLEASHIDHMLRHTKECVVLKETGSQGKCGVLTTNQRKMEFVAVLEDLLLQNAICISDRLVSDDPDTCLKTLRKQLEHYRMLSNEIGRNTVFGAPKVTYSGKVGEDGRPAHSLQDDLCISLQMAAFWSSYVIQRRCKFLNYASIYM